jgi:hypothetical protein
MPHPCDERRLAWQRLGQAPLVILWIRAVAVPVVAQQQLPSWDR